MSEQQLNYLNNTQKNINTTIKKLRVANKSFDIKLYQTQLLLLEDQISLFEQQLKQTKETTDLNGESLKKVELFENWLYSIHNSIPPVPQIVGKEDTPLLNKQENDLRQQSAVTFALHQENTDQIKTIVEKQRDLHEAFSQLNGMVQIQQVHIDAIEHNAFEADKKIDEGNTEIDKAEKYQRKSSKKLKIILIVALCIVFVLALLVGIILYIKMN